MLRSDPFHAILSANALMSESQVPVLEQGRALPTLVELSHVHPIPSSRERIDFYNNYLGWPTGQPSIAILYCSDKMSGEGRGLLSAGYGREFSAGLLRIRIQL